MRAGARTKLTEAVVNKICDAISIGANTEIAAKYAGVSQASMMSWLKIARDEKKRREDGEKPIRTKRIKLCLEFLEQYDLAQSEAAISWLQVIDNAARGRDDPVWARYLLEVHYRETYGLKNQITNLNIDLSKLTDEQVERLANGEDPLNVLAISGTG